jgi:hypothetical protein
VQRDAKAVNSRGLSSGLLRRQKRQARRHSKRERQEPNRDLEGSLQTVLRTVPGIYVLEDSQLFAIIAFHGCQRVMQPKKRDVGSNSRA